MRSGGSSLIVFSKLGSASACAVGWFDTELAALVWRLLPAGVACCCWPGRGAAAAKLETDIGSSSKRAFSQFVFT